MEQIPQTAEAISKLKSLQEECYEAVANKNGTVPEKMTMEKLPEAIASIHDTLEELVITQNGEYTPQEGVDGFSKVVAKFDTSSLPKVKVSSLRVSNNCINDEGRWEGEQLIDTSEVTTFNEVFENNKKIIHLNASNWNTSNLTSINLMFFSCSKLKHINTYGWNTTNLVKTGRPFSLANNVEIIDFRTWDATKMSNLTNDANGLFFGLGKLLSLIGGVKIEEVISNNITALKNASVNIVLSNSTNLDRASLRALINGLADLTGQTAKTLTLGTKLIAKLTEEDIAIATAKNWTIA